MKTHLYLLKVVTTCMTLLLACNHSFGQLTITPAQSANTLAQSLAGSGITIINASLTCAAQANGQFTAVASNLGIDTGILLTTGQAIFVAGSEPGLTSSNNNTNGDPALQALSGAATTRDACILQFDLIPKGDTIKFDYVFGSEEYINSICGPYNDAFAFFISGPGISGLQNMAQVPGTTIPVAVNSINSGTPGLYGNIVNCTSMGPGAPFTTYYNNNQNGATVAYRGLTNVLVASHAVNPCDTYHLKLTIADALNGLYDSGVFIKAGSLQSASFGLDIAGAVNVAGIPSIYKGCSSGSITFSRSVAKPTPQVLSYQISGTAVNGIDFSAITNTITIPANATQAALSISGLITPPSGMKTLKLYLNAPYSCNGMTEIIDSVEMQIFDAPHAILLSQDTTICQGATFQMQVDGDDNLTYKWTPSQGLNNENIKNPIADPEENTTYIMRAYIPDSGCDTLTGDVTINVLVTPWSTDAGSDINVCEHSPILINPAIVPDNTDFTYLWNGPQGFSTTNRELSLPDPVIPQSGTYTFTVDGGICGSVKDSVYINIVQFPLPPQVTSPLRICLNSKMKPIDVTGNDLKWYKDAVGGQPIAEPDVNTSRESNEDYYVSQSYGACESERTKLTIIVERCCDDFIFIPSVFTPNSDGKNDLFEISLKAESRIMNVEIFNRWGQLVYHQNSNKPWDGTFNGVNVDMGNYYYNISYTCKDGTVMNKKGEVLVVR
ncbi:gliding motility-associated C-terminal domain-containing protein [Taibaiella lutea]|uniref:Gliding motility-associated C-terminal domain-containing protein n=1 Tax=Taibaiella lutea TaxID=2608001 RepID=A0A5M6CN15_9BACT|nr:choice-of-anchor L domain-containing protein [Taibaiella lutea]KAA5534539.1 gliding motility-associated C-terminal domain-containing protein [Taibaiella lutea]